MSEQVGRLVGNLLAGGGEVFLPEVGSLYVERRGARRIDRRHLLPPCRTVLFTSQQRGPSLVDEIARILRVNGVRPEHPESEARTVYDRWIAQAREDDTLTVAGVGVLRFKHFKPDPEFDRRLNPQGHEPVRVRAPRRFDAVLWFGVAAIVCVLGGTAWWWYGLRGQSGASDVRPAVERRAETLGTESAAMPADSLSGEALPAGRAEIASGDVGPAENAVRTDTGVKTAADPETAAVRNAAPVRSGDGVVPSRMVSGRHYVVMGVFSTVRNAERAVQAAASKDVAISCGIYCFGSKFMVSPFESEDPEACRLFARAHEERFPGMWTYTAR